MDVSLSSSLQTFEQREALLLAPYATFSRDSRGREHSEPAHPYRGPFQRDRDRILHSAAYRRLSGKTQVFTGAMGDYHRTRLTHTQEVASIARTMGRVLRLNEDLIEALALFHDIGHPPFGHAGEDALSECLADQGGFSHNQYGLTIARELEQRYTSYPGLNLTWEVLEGQATRVDKTADHRPRLEAQIVDLADSITYDAHDVDDAVKLGLLTLEQLSELPLIREAIEAVKARSGPLEGKLLRKAVIHQLIDLQVSDVVEVAEARLQSLRSPVRWVALTASEQLVPLKAELEAFLYEHVYRHPKLIAVRTQAQERLRAMFDVLLRQPERLPERYRQRSDDVGLARSIADYLAGMTDHYCDQQFQRLCPGR